MNNSMNHQSTQDKQNVFPDTIAPLPPFNKPPNLFRRQTSVLRQNESSFFGRKNFLVSRLCSVQKKSKSFFQRKSQPHEHDDSDDKYDEIKRTEGLTFKAKLQLRKRLSLNLIETETSRSLKSPTSPSEDVNIQLLTPQNFRFKANSFPRTKSEEPTAKAVKNDFKDYNKNKVSRKLSKYEFKFVEKTFIKKRCSMCFLLDCGIENSAFFLQQQNHQVGPMEKSQPKRHKIARCMVRFNALNSSRPRTETGQPITFFDRKPRCLTYYENRRSSNSDLIRTLSDPDMYRSTLQLQNLENCKDKDSVFPKEKEEIYTPYTAVGSSEDVRGLSAQLTVQEILTNFEDKRTTPPKPAVKPRKNLAAASANLTNSKEETKHTKPIPLPRPSKSTVKELNGKFACNNNSIKDSEVTHESKRPHPAISPKPKPKRIVKAPLLPKQNSSNDGGLSDSQSSNGLSIALTVAGKLGDSSKPSEAHNKMYSAIAQNISLTPNLDNTSGNAAEKLSSEINEKTPSVDVVAPAALKRTVTKQKSTKVAKPVNDIAYAVVTLQESIPPTPNPIMSKEELELDLNSSANSNNYDTVYPQAEEAVSPLTPTTPNVYLEPTDVIDCSDDLDTEKKSGLSTKEKRKRFKKKSPISKSMAMKKNPTSAEDINRRQSLPEFHNQNQEINRMSLHEYEDIHIQSGPYTLTPPVDIISPAGSDDECWNSDEFDSSSGEDDEEEEGFTEQPIPKLAHLEGTKKKLYNIVTEILSTERAYVKRLYLLDQVFHQRIQEESKKDSNVIPEKTIKEIFPNLSPIFKFHSTILLPELEKRITEWEENDKIGNVFKTLGHCLLLYTEYVKNFDNATTTLNHWLKKSPKFASLIQELQKDPKCEHLSLQHHMLEPIQRVPRYKLLLSDYLKRLPEDSPDRKESEASLVIISKAAENANNSMKENEKFKKLLDIEDRIVDGIGETLVTASRVFVKEGELTKLASRSGNRMSRTIMLFNDLLLCSQLTKIGKLKVRHLMDLNGLTIIDNDSELPELSFRIKSKQKVLDLTAQNEEEKEEWVTAIRDCVEDTENKRGSRVKQNMNEEEETAQQLQIGQQAPLWVKDEFVSMCMLCAAKFGMIHRKHHCRGCGRVICGKCSNYHAPLAYAANEVKRVCYSCSKKLGIISPDEQPTNNQEKFKDSVRKRDSRASDFHGEVYWKAPGKEFKKEWLYLSDFALYVQKKKQDVKAHFSLPVPGFEIESASQNEESDIPYPFCTKLHKAQKKDMSYYIASDNEQLIIQWEHHLRAASQATKYVADES